MEQLTNGFTLEITEGCFPLSTDSMALAHFVRMDRGARVLDLGSGCGTLGLLLCAGDPTCRVTGVELEEAAHHCAAENIRRNSLEDRMESIHSDLRTWEYTPGSFDCCVTNPPYFTGGPAARLQNARREDTCPPDALFSVAAKALKFGGDLFMVHRPERLAQLCACAAGAGLEPKRLCLLRHKEGAPVTLILLQCRKGGKPGLVWEELCLRNADGSPTEAYQQIYHL